MSYYDVLTLIMESVVFTYLMVKLFYLNPKVNKIIIILVLLIDYFISTAFTLHLFISPPINTLYFFVFHSIFVFGYVYYFYKGSFINNLIKISLIKILYLLSELPVFFILTKFFNANRDHPKTISLYGSNESLLFTVFALILFIAITKTLDKQFSGWVFSLIGIFQKVMFTTCVVVPLVIGTILEIQYVNRVYFFNPMALSTFQIILNVLSLVIIVILGVSNKRRNLELIEDNIKQQNSKYESFINLEMKMALLRHDVANFLEVNDEKIKKSILDYCDKIEKEINSLDD